MEGVLHPGDVERFRADGFLPARPLLDDTKLADLVAALDRILARQSEHDPAAMRNLYGDEANVVIQVVNAWEAEDAFFRHLFEPALTSSIAELMGVDTVRVWHDQIQVKPPLNGGPTIWHQDYPYWPVIEPAELVSAWVALEDADEENGCMSMVPRSHLWGTYGDGTVGSREDDWGPAHREDFVPNGEQATPTPCPVKAGQVMFHHCMTWHGAPPNRSTRRRPAIAVHYMPGHTRFVPRASHLIEDTITVAPGEILIGDHFPTVFEDGGPLEPSKPAAI